MLIGSSSLLLSLVAYSPPLPLQVVYSLTTWLPGCQHLCMSVPKCPSPQPDARPPLLLVGAAGARQPGGGRPLQPRLQARHELHHGRGVQRQGRELGRGLRLNAALQLRPGY